MAGPEDLEHEVVHHEKSLWGDVIALVVIVIPLDSGNFIEWVIEGLKTTQTISDNEKMASQLQLEQISQTCEAKKDCQGHSSSCLKSTQTLLKLIISM